jgi:hypothetical protein
VKSNEISRNLGEGDAEDFRRQLFALTEWLYEGFHFAIMSVYEFPELERKLRTTNPTPEYEKRHDHDFMGFYIGTSRDGEDWDLQWVYKSQPLIERGPDGSFDKDGVRPPANIITLNDRHWSFYSGMNERHNLLRRQLAFGLATLRLDGFIALEAGDEPGVLITKPFLLEGSQLEVNAEALNGAVKIEVLDASGAALPSLRRSYRNIDELRLRPDWDGGADLNTLMGKPVRLKFTLRNARLYAFQIRP